MKTLPINLSIEGQRVLVIGGGFFAVQKVERLIAYNPELTIVAEQVSDELRTMIDTHGITQLSEPYRAEHLDGFAIVYSAVEDRAEAERIYEDSRKRSVLLNTVDSPELCDFIMPAVVQGEHFALSISTGGKAAGLSKQLREELEVSLAQEDEILDLLEQVREIFQKKYASFEERRDHLRTILEELRALESEPTPDPSKEGN